MKNKTHKPPPEMSQEEFEESIKLGEELKALATQQFEAKESERLDYLSQKSFAMAESIQGLYETILEDIPSSTPDTKLAALGAVAGAISQVMTVLYMDAKSEAEMEEESC